MHYIQHDFIPQQPELSKDMSKDQTNMLLIKSLVIN